MKNYMVAGRYARGLSESIADFEELNAAARALRDLRAVYEGSHALQNVLATPALRLEKRLRVLREVLTAAETPPKVRSFVELLLRRGRINYLGDVTEVFNSLADERLGRVRAHVTTAVPLDAEQETRLRTAFEQHTGREVRMETEVDKDVLGGVVARIGSVIIDGSIHSRLRRLRTALLTEEHAQ